MRSADLCRDVQIMSVVPRCPAGGGCRRQAIHKDNRTNIPKRSHHFTSPIFVEMCAFSNENSTKTNSFFEYI